MRTEGTAMVEPFVQFLIPCSLLHFGHCMDCPLYRSG